MRATEYYNIPRNSKTVLGVYFYKPAQFSLRVLVLGTQVPFCRNAVLAGERFFAPLAVLRTALGHSKTLGGAALVEGGNKIGANDNLAVFSRAV